MGAPIHEVPLNVCLICGRDITENDEFALLMGIYADSGYRTWAPVAYLCPDCLHDNEDRFYKMSTSDILDMSGGLTVVEMGLS